MIIYINFNYANNNSALKGCNCCELITRGYPDSGYAHANANANANLELELPLSRDTLEHVEDLPRRGVHVLGEERHAGDEVGLPWCDLQAVVPGGHNDG